MCALESRILATVTYEGDEIVVAGSTLDAGRFDVHLAADATGNFAVGWGLSTLYTGGPVNSTVTPKVQRFISNGTLNGSTVALAGGQTISPLPLSIHAPDLAMSKDGKLYASYMYQYYFSNPLNPITQPEIDFFGTSTSVPAPSYMIGNSGSENTTLKTATSVDSSGNGFLLTYNRFAFATGKLYSFPATSSSPGASATLLTTLPAGPADVAALGSGAGVWVSVQSGAVQVRRFTTGPYSATSLANANSTSTPDANTQPLVVANGTGAFVVGWMINGKTEIHAQRYDAAGNKVGSEFTVASGIPAGVSPQFDLAIDAAGDFAFAWTSYYSGFSDLDVFARIYKSDGTPDGAAFFVNDQTYVGDQFSPAIAMGDNGKFVVAWSTGTGGPVHLQRFTTDVVPADVVKPTVLTMNFSYDVLNDPMALVVDYSEAVTGLSATSLPSSSFTVQNLSDLSFVDGTAMLLSQPVPSRARLMFPGSPAVIPDGNYRLTVVGANVRDLANNTMNGTATYDFFFLQGDITRDRKVDTTDFNVMAANFGQANKTFSAGNLNYDAVIDSTDFSILISRFGKRLPTPAESVPLAGSPFGAVTLSAIEDDDRLSNDRQQL
jgi:hypothetical protein